MTVTEMSTQNMKLIIVKLLIGYPRINFDLSAELAKYADIVWLNGWLQFDDYKHAEYNFENHQVLQLGNSGRIRKKWSGVLDEIRFILRVIKYLKNNPADLVVIHSHRLAFLYPILYHNPKYVIQIYTLSVSGNRFRRALGDIWERLINYPYKRFLVGSEYSITMFGLGRRKCYVSGLSLKPISTLAKNFDSLNLVYIGTLHNRRIYDTLEGLQIFIATYTGGKKVSYDIIGSGKPEDVQIIKDAIEVYGLQEVVTYHGFLADNEVATFFDKCNIGVAYVPITDYYTNVMVTKLYEYLLSGMAAIATATNENKKIISPVNGVLVEDTPDGFAAGLGEIISKMDSYASHLILETVKSFATQNYVRDKYLPMLTDIIRN